MFRKNFDYKNSIAIFYISYILQVYASITDNYLAEAIANFAEIHDNGFLKGILVILYYIVDFTANYGP